MDDITILKNRLAYFSNRVSYKSDFEEIDLKIDYEKETEPEYDDEVNDEEYKEYIHKELVNKVKQLIRNENIDLNKNTYKELRDILNISKDEVRELIDVNYEEFMNEQEIVYKKQGKEYEEEEEQEEEEDKEKIKLGKKMKKLLKTLKK
jgi:hypothetical protein